MAMVSCVCIDMNRCTFIVSYIVFSLLLSYNPISYEDFRADPENARMQKK